ncbi:MAG: TIGR00266 family protein [Planctomycetota bacterium]
MADGIDFQIEQQPDYAIVRLRLQPGETVYSEPSAMASMSPGIDLKAGLKGGLLRSLGRAFGGESLIVNTYTAREAGELVLAPGPAGDLQHIHLHGNRILVQRGGYLAHSGTVSIDGKWGGFKGFFAEGMVLLQASGEGDLWFNSYGAILQVDVRDAYYVDTGYVVAFDDTLDYDLTTMPGLSWKSRAKSFLFGGDGLVCRFRGEGRVWLQTRMLQPWLNFLWPFRPSKNNN